MNVIFYPPEEVRPLAAVDTAGKVWQHAWFDARSAGRVSMAGMGASLLALMASGILGAQTGEPASFISQWLLYTNGALCAFTALAYKELRDKLGYMRESFNASAAGFSKTDTQLMSKFNEALFKPRPILADYFLNFKSYPVQAAVAWITIAAAAATRQPALLAMGAVIFGCAVMGEEAVHTREISDKALRAKEYVETVRKLRLEELGL